MKTLTSGIMCAIYAIIQPCSGIKLLNIPETPLPQARRYWIKNFGEHNVRKNLRQAGYEDEKDANLKSKISTLVEQTIYDTDQKIKSVQPQKEANRVKSPYRVGFILSMVKKTRDVLNELFDVAVKHRDEWKALEQLKIFEMMVHTNVDTTDLVRQLVEVHVLNLNATQNRRRVLLLK